jgi:hypothetical protein
VPLSNIKKQILLTSNQILADGITNFAFCYCNADFAIYDDIAEVTTESHVTKTVNALHFMYQLA